MKESNGKTRKNRGYAPVNGLKMAEVLRVECESKFRILKMA